MELKQPRGTPPITVALLLMAAGLASCAVERSTPRDAAGHAEPRDAGRPDAKVNARDAQVPLDAGIAAWQPALPMPRGTPCPADRMPPVLDEDSGVPSSGTTSPFVLSTKPQLGEVTATSARVWLRTDATADVCIEYWSSDAPNKRATVLGPRLEAAHDFTGVVALGGLLPSTRYAYQVLLAKPGASFALHATQALGFRTTVAAGTPGKMRIVFGADIAGGHGSGHAIFESMQAQQPDLVLLIGDLFYARGTDEGLDAYRGRARGTWSKPQLDTLAANVPTLGMWDDHDIVDNYYAGRSPRYAYARGAFDEYTAARNPPPVRPSELYFATTLGEVDLFVLDVRTHRTSNEAVDGPDKSMLGRAQRDDLKSWLLGSRGKVKILVSPVLFADHSTTRNDAWSAFAHEREDIFDFIVRHRIDNVLLLSGDQHWGAIFKLVRGDTRYAFYEFQATPLSKSPKSAPDVHGDDVVAVFGGDTLYGVVDVDTRPASASVSLTLCRGVQPCAAGAEPEPSTGSVPFTLHLPLAKIGLP
jgi:alkaline phosphatase D